MNFDSLLSTSYRDFPSLKRRRFLTSLFAFGGIALHRANTPSVWAATAVPDEHALSGFDHEMEQFMSERGVPGGALAVVKDCRLVYARGYGLANREQKIPASAQTLFRIASVSKPITAVAIMKLVEQGKLKLDARAWDLLPSSTEDKSGKQPDSRLAQITVQQLLNHTAGWDRDKSYDPMFRSAGIARTLNMPSPPDAKAIIRYMRNQPLDFDPGARYAYSNFGYCLLGRIIEQVTQTSYEDYVKNQILSPMGVQRMRVGSTLESRAGADEAHYYTADISMGKSVFDQHPGSVPTPYGTFCLEAMDAHGGWIASAVDIARFAAALDNAKKPFLLPKTLGILYAPPPPPVSRNNQGRLEPVYYASGWQVRPLGPVGKANYWHNGSLPGTNSLLVRLANGLSWVALFNQRSDDNKRPDGAIDAALHRAAATVREWPDRNLFETL